MTYEVPIWLPVRPLVAFIGQGVGPREYERGRPFIGPSGKQLYEWELYVGLEPDEQMYTNIEMTYHPDEPNYKPTPDEIIAALPRILDELGWADSVMCVVLLGEVASHLAFKGRMGSMLGRIGKLAGLTALPCWHPAYYLRAEGFRKRAEIESAILGVLAQAAAITTGDTVVQELPVPKYEGRIDIT